MDGKGFADVCVANMFHRVVQGAATLLLLRGTAASY